MTDVFQLNPSFVETGIPITVSIKQSDVPADSKTLTVLHQGAEPILANLLIGPNGTLFSQFALYEPGEYRMQVGTHEKTFTVVPRKDISFFFEVGVLTLSVTSFLGGLIVWSWKNRNKKAGSFSQSGQS